MQHQEFWDSVSRGFDSAREEGAGGSVWLKVVEERGRGPKDKNEWAKAVLSRRVRSSSDNSSQSTTDEQISLSSTSASPLGSPERLYHVKNDFDMSWFRANEVEAKVSAGSDEAAKLSEHDEHDEEDDENGNTTLSNNQNVSSCDFSPSLGRKDSLLTASFLSMNMNAGKSEDHHREKVPDQDLYDSYSGGAFSFPTTPSCNEDEIEEQQEDPQLNWPVQSASQSPVQQLQFDDEAFSSHEEDKKLINATSGGGGTSTRHITESDMQKHRQQQDDMEFTHGSFGFHTQVPNFRRINSKSNFTWTSSCSTTESVLDDEREKERERGKECQPSLQEDENDCEVMHLKVIHTKGKTGLEETQEFPIVYQQVVANRYRIVDTLGKSAFSRAVQAIDLSNGSSVCLKIINNTKESFDQGLDEVRILKKIVKTARQRNMPGDDECYGGSNLGFVKILDYFYFKEHLFIVTELLKANLYEFQQSNRSGGSDVYFTKGRIQHIAKQMLKSISVLHSMQILHADLKPENILLENYSKATIKIIDLGSARFAHEEPYPYVQSRCYRAPEVILGAGYDEKIDIWSIGAILCELYTGKVLFPCNSNHSLLAQIVSCLGPLPATLLSRSKYAGKFITKSGLLYGESEESGNYEVYVPKNLPITERVSEDSLFIEFLLQLLAPDPRWRCTAEEALQLPWLNQPQ